MGPRPRRALPVALLILLSACGIAAPERAATPGAGQGAAAAAPPTALPNRDGSLKFAVLGDFGTGDSVQYELGKQMAAVHAGFPYELVLLVGDNIYGAERPQDFKRKFEDPYKPLLDAGVKFYASLGNHDSREQRYYKLFNMEGRFYYSFKAPKQDVRFFALDSTYPEPEQIEWVANELENSGEAWKIAYFHHPLYSSGGRHGSDLRLRETLEPIFLNENVSVVFAGHDHFYERIKPQHEMTHFVVGSGGKLRAGNIENGSPLTAKGFDTNLAFLVAEIVDDELYFNAVSRTGAIVDSGVIERRRTLEEIKAGEAPAREGQPPPAAPPPPRSSPPARPAPPAMP